VLELMWAAEVLAKEIQGDHLYFLIIQKMHMYRLPLSKVSIKVDESKIKAVLETFYKILWRGFILLGH
jgi:hypothetical protein